MERLTFFENGRWWIRLNGDMYGGFPEVDRLAAYEDTGLEPEEVTAIKHALMGQEIAKITEFEGIPIKRMIGLAQAEKDGRLVVLPPNDPLTLEELREMEGEPVYDWMGYEWFVVSEVTDDEVIMTDGTVFDIDEDSPNNADRRFCRRKPEEGTG